MLRSMLLLLAATSLPALAAPAGQYETAFDALPPLASRAEVARRLLHGFQWQRVAALAAARGDRLDGAGVDPATERWEVYAPARCAAGETCGVLVWVHPWEDASLPRDWPRVLDAHGIIYVSARRSGNSQDVLDRRVPLALTGLAGVQARYAVDPTRVYTGGFSGGGRVASRMAIGYAEVFSGGLFVGTADGPGSSDAPVPDGAALDALLERGRYLLLVGSEDPENLDISRQAWRNFRAACVFDARLQVVTGWHHRNADARWLGRALEFLDRGPRVAAAERAACLTRVTAEARAAVAAAQDRDALLVAHRRYGGFVAGEFAAALARLPPE